MDSQVQRRIYLDLEAILTVIVAYIAFGDAPEPYLIVLLYRSHKQIMKTLEKVLAAQYRALAQTELWTRFCGTHYPNALVYRNPINSRQEEISANSKLYARDGDRRILCSGFASENGDVFQLRVISPTPKIIGLQTCPINISFGPPNANGINYILVLSGRSIKVFDLVENEYKHIASINVLSNETLVEIRYLPKHKMYCIMSEGHLEFLDCRNPDPSKWAFALLPDEISESPYDVTETETHVIIMIKEAIIRRRGGDTRHVPYFVVYKYNLHSGDFEILFQSERIYCYQEDQSDVATENSGTDPWNLMAIDRFLLVRYVPQGQDDAFTCMSFGIIDTETGKIGPEFTMTSERKEQVSKVVTCYIGNNAILVSWYNSLYLMYLDRKNLTLKLSKNGLYPVCLGSHSQIHCINLSFFDNVLDVMISQRAWVDGQVRHFTNLRCHGVWEIAGSASA